MQTLPRELIIEILSHVGTTKELAKCCILSHFFANIFNEPRLWKEVAVRKYGRAVAEATIGLYGGDENWQNMMRDDNRRGALPTIDLSETTISETHCFHIAALQWDRANHRLYFHIDIRMRQQFLLQIRHDLFDTTTQFAYFVLYRGVGEDRGTVIDDEGQFVLTSEASNGCCKGIISFSSAFFDERLQDQYRQRGGTPTDMVESVEPSISIQIRSRLFMIDNGDFAYDFVRVARDGYFAVRVAGSIFENESEETERARWQHVPDILL